MSGGRVNSLHPESDAAAVATALAADEQPGPQAPEGVRAVMDPNFPGLDGDEHPETHKFFAFLEANSAPVTQPVSTKNSFTQLTESEQDEVNMVAAIEKWSGSRVKTGKKPPQKKNPITEVAN